MATKIWYFTGTTKWAKVFTPDDKYGNYELCLFLDKEGKKKFKESGLQLELKEDDDGEFIRLRRPIKKLMNGELVEFGAPEVVDKDNTPFTELIGNGSVITAKVAVYDTQKGKGHRLEAVRVEEHVPYAKGEVDTNVRAPF